MQDWTRMILIFNQSFTEDDELYILGDVSDRGLKSMECIKRIIEQDIQKKVVD